MDAMNSSRATMRYVKMEFVSNVSATVSAVIIRCCCDERHESLFYAHLFISTFWKFGAVICVQTQTHVSSHRPPDDGNRNRDRVLTKHSAFLKIFSEILIISTLSPLASYANIA
jgi:hypothetical protein